MEPAFIVWSCKQRRGRGVKVTIVVFADGSWAMEVPNQQMRYGETFGTEMGEVRWDKMAEGLAARGYMQKICSAGAVIGYGRGNCRASAGVRTNKPGCKHVSTARNADAIWGSLSGAGKLRRQRA